MVSTGTKPNWMAGGTTQAMTLAKTQPYIHISLASRGQPGHLGGFSRNTGGWPEKWSSPDWSAVEGPIRSSKNQGTEGEAGSEFCKVRVPWRSGRFPISLSVSQAQPSEGPRIVASGGLGWPLFWFCGVLHTDWKSRACISSQKKGAESGTVVAAWPAWSL